MPEYVDYAEYYDSDIAFPDDIPFYLGYANRTGSPVLELACGTGRILLPLAEAGHTVHGIDISENMLAIAREKVAQAGPAERISLTHANMADFDLPKKSFALIFVAFRSFMHLLTQEDQQACLSRVWSHLRPGGLFIVDVFSPNLSILASPCDPEYKVEKEYGLPNGHRVVRKHRFVKKDFINQINEVEFLFEEYGQSEQIARQRVVPIRMRYSFRYELQLLLDKAGFEIESLFGYFDKRAYDGKDEIIFVAAKPSD
jgi:ubiquinone/menaquinone biosynthesis C-methylase UbiE